MKSVFTWSDVQETVHGNQQTDWNMEELANKSDESIYGSISWLETLKGGGTLLTWLLKM